MYVSFFKQDGATLLHYAVQTASSQAIKILLLYNVDINLPDDVCSQVLRLILWSFVSKSNKTKIILLSGWLDSIASCCANKKDRYCEAFVN